MKRPFAARKHEARAETPRPRGLQCQQNLRDAFFIYDGPGIKEATPFELRDSYTMSSAAPTSLPARLSSHPLGEGQRILFLLLLGLSVWSL